MTILNEGWEAIEGDLLRIIQTKAETVSSLRQAYKNGASAVLARLVVRGPTAIAPLFDDVCAMQFLRPYAEWMRDKAHPEWTEHHLDCVFAGGWAMLLTMMSNTPENIDGFREDIDSFKVEVVNQ